MSRVTLAKSTVEIKLLTVLSLSQMQRDLVESVCTRMKITVETIRISIVQIDWDGRQRGTHLHISLLPFRQD